MGQATRQFKTKADASIRMGSLGIGGMLNRTLAQAQRNVALTAKRINPNIRVNTPLPPSKAIPNIQNLAYLGGRPEEKPLSDLQKQIEDFYGSMRTKVTDPIKSFAAGHPIDDAWHQKDVVDVAAVGQKALSGISDAVQTNVANPFRDKKHDYVAPARPADETLKMLKERMDLALSDNTWTPEERQQIVSSYRNFIQKFVADDNEDLKSMNNWSVQSAYKQLVQQSRKAQAEGSAKGGDGLLGDFFGQAADAGMAHDLGEFYDGELMSAADDKYGPGFILSADEDGFYKIVSIRDLRHQIEAQARDNPQFAARLIAGMAAYGSYGGGTDKYAQGRIQFDAAGNPVRATFNVDDENALGQFLSDIAKDQEQAMNGQELQPWDAIMDQHAAQNAAIGATPGYGQQEAAAPSGRGYGGYGGGGGGGFGGGGGGVSYTDSDQLKQLINGIARSRLGYVLNDQQIAEFVAEYHAKEAAFVNARTSGQSGQQLDPESQAASWIEAHFRDPMAANQANNYISSLAAFLLGGSFGSTS